MTRIRKKQRRNKNKKIKQGMAGKLLGYSAVAGAALVVGAPRAEAVPVTLSGPFSDHFIDFDGDGADDVVFNLFTSSNFVSTGSFSNRGTALAYGSNGARIAKYSTIATSISGSTFSVPAAQRFALSSSVGAGSFNNYGGPAILAYQYSYASTSYSHTVQAGPFLGQRGFMGVRFDAGQNGGPLDLAFVELEVSSDAKKLTIHSYGEKTAPVPEPATLSSLAVGIGGLYAMRRRNAKLKKSTDKS